MTYPIPTQNVKVIDIDYKQTVTMPSKGCLEEIKQKVCDVVQSKWTIVAAAGLIVALAYSLTAGIVVGLVGAGAAWYFAPIEGDDLNVITANVLGIFTDPFEFMGDYGPFINSVKAEVEGVVNGDWIRYRADDGEGMMNDFNKGPLTKDLLPDALKTQMRQKMIAMGAKEENLTRLDAFFEHHAKNKLYNLLMNIPPQSLLKLDKEIKEAMERAGGAFDLPSLNSPAPIVGNNALAHKTALIERLFTPQNFQIAKNIMEKVNKKLPGELSEFQRLYSQINVSPTAIQHTFSTPEGLMYFYGAHQSMILDLLATKEGLVAKVNQAKAEFMQTLGDPVKRAEHVVEGFIKADADVVMTQECDRHVALAFEQRGWISTHSYIGQDGQKVTLSNDGSVLFLNPKKFSPKMKAIIDTDQKTPEEIADARAPVFVGSLLKNNVPFVFMPSHGHAEKKELIHGQIDFAASVLWPIKKQDPRTRFAIGSDTNLTNGESHTLTTTLMRNGFAKTNVRATENKTRVTGSLRAKLYKPAQNEKDAIITDGSTGLTGITVAGKEELDLSKPIPNLEVRADHAPLAATLVQLPILLKA